MHYNTGSSKQQHKHLILSNITQHQEAKEVYILNFHMPTEDNLTGNNLEKPTWFAMSATFGRELKAKTFLESKSVRCFIPMQYKIVKDKEQGKIRALVPAIKNLIFVYTTKERIQSLKTLITYLQYLTKPISGRNVPITIPERQMQQFIKVCDTHDDKLTYLAPDEINLDKGTPVKIIGGIFDGVTGTFIRVDKGYKKCVVVLIQNTIAVMIAKFTDGYLHVLK